MANKRQFQMFMMVTMLSTANDMETQQILQQMSQLASAATSAAQAATEATQAFTKASGSTTQGLESATKILKSPDTFTGDDPLLFSSWKLQFESWLSFGDARFTGLLMKTKQGSEPDHTVYRTNSIGQQVLCGVEFDARSWSEPTSNTFQSLVSDVPRIPSTRQRSLAIAQNLGQYPGEPV